MTASIRYCGALRDCPAKVQQDLLNRLAAASDSSVSSATSAIIERVLRSGDAALLELAKEFDGVSLNSLEVPTRTLRKALDDLQPQVRSALERARDNIVTVQRAFMPATQEIEVEPGVRVGRRVDSLARAGVYAPGGRAAYPSSVLMGCIPAKVAGVGEVILSSPPGPDGVPPAAVLAAAALVEVDAVFAIGGAGAIAAMAYGTESVPRVDRIVGPGNAYVAEAKRQLSHIVDIDSFAGPSELLVLADSSADPDVVAAELIAQAEHDPDAAVVAIALDENLADEIREAFFTRAATSPRASIISRAVARNGAIMWEEDLDEALGFACAYAPEHLLLALHEPRNALDRIRNAGAVFLGQTTSVTFGDYITGANHVLPTAGFSRTHSALSVHDFLRWTTYQEVDARAAVRLSSDVAVLAAIEGLPGHAAAARQWSGAMEARR
jgi:histidinol dehydrogenase